MVERDVFFWNQSHDIIYPNEENAFMVTNREKKKIILWICVCWNRLMNINSKNGGKGCFSYETKASIPFIPIGEWICGTQSVKERRLVCESEFIQLKIEH